MNTSVLISSDHIYMEDGCHAGTLWLKDGKIANIFLNQEELPQGIQHLQYQDAMIIPGIIDVHSHGYLSWSAKTIDKDEIKGLSNILPSIGVTATLATTTAWKEEEFHMLSSIADAIEESCMGATILGIHMEGPFYNPNNHNATPRHEVIPPTLEKAKEYVNAARGHLKYMTIAPEVEGALPVITWLTQQGIIMGAGHTSATAEEFKKGLGAGIQVSIHTGNAMKQIDRRDVGALGIALLEPSIYCEMICDLFHLSKEMIEIMLKTKQDYSKIIMMSDSDLLSGIAPGSYHAFGKNVHVHEDGRILLDDGTISGSSKYVLYGIQNLVQKLNLPLETILPFFSLNPATLLGIQQQKGSIKKGKDADIVVLNNNYEVLSTFVEGTCRYTKGDKITLNPRFAQVCQKLT